MTEGDRKVLPVVNEELVPAKRVVKTGSVRVQKYIDRRFENISMPLVRETVEVRRVPINRVIEAMPDTQTTGDTTIIPVVEEELVVSKRLVLKEEIHMVRRRTEVIENHEVALGNERVEVQRLDPEGRIVEPSTERLRGLRLSRRRGGERA